MKVFRPTDFLTLARGFRAYMPTGDSLSRRNDHMKALLIKDFLTLGK